MTKQKRTSFVFYDGFYEAIQELETAEEKVELLDAICTYEFTGEIPEMSYACRVAFKVIKKSLDTATIRYLASVENGKKGGRPKKEENLTEPTGTYNNLGEPTGTQGNHNVNGNGNGNVNESGNENENEKQRTCETSSQGGAKSTTSSKRISRKEQLVNYVQGLQCSEAVKQELFNWIFGIGLDRGVTVKQLTSKVNDIWTDCDNDESLVQQALHNSYKNGWFGFFRPNTASPKTTEKHEPSSFTNIPHNNNIAEDPEYQARLDALRADGWRF